MTGACILLSLIVLLTFCAVLPDLLAWGKNWVGRIGIGRLSPPQAREKIAAVARRWLQKTPAVPVSDQTRFTLPERLRGVYASRKVQSWQQAALLLGVAQTGDTQAVRAFRDTVLTADGRWRQTPESADAALLAYALLRTAEHTDAVRAAMDDMYALLRRTAAGGTVPYTARAAHLRFVDTVGMVCPFLYLYSKTYHCPEAEALCQAQLAEYAEKGLHPATGLPFHAIRPSDGAQLGIGDWGRGCGWYATALAELLRCGADAAVYAEPLSRRLLSLQLSGGAFSRQLLSESCPESTATAMLGHFMYVYGQAADDAACRAAAEKAMRFLHTATRRDGTVDYAQGDTKGIGFYSTRLAPMPAAQGFAALLGEELS